MSPITWKLTILVLIAGAGGGAAAESDPAMTVGAFFEWRTKSPTSGAPSPAEELEIRRFVTSELACLLRLSRQYHDLFAAKFPEEKPPYEEGDLYSSSFEGPTRAVVDDVKLNGTRAVVRVHLFYEDKDNDSGWYDRVHLRFEDGKWQISDFERTADFLFGSSGFLLKNLYGVLSKSAPSVGWRGKDAHSCRSSSR